VGQILVVVPQRTDQRDAVVVGIGQRPVHRLDDHVLVGTRRGAVLRSATCTVVQPRVDVEGHVHHVDPDVGRVGEGVHGRGKEEEAAVLAATDVDQRHVRGDTGADYADV